MAARDDIENSTSTALAVSTAPVRRQWNLEHAVDKRKKLTDDVMRQIHEAARNYHRHTGGEVFAMVVDADPELGTGGVVHESKAFATPNLT